MIRLPRDQEDRIIAVYEEGHSRDDTARICGCSPDTVMNVFRRRGLSMRSRGGPRFKLTHGEHEATRVLYEAGYSETEIGAILGRSRGAISWRLRYGGVKRRTPSEAQMAKQGFRPDPELLLAPYEGVRVAEWKSLDSQDAAAAGEGKVSRPANEGRGFAGGHSSPPARRGQPVPGFGPV